MLNVQIAVVCVCVVWLWMVVSLCVAVWWSGDLCRVPPCRHPMTTWRGPSLPSWPWAQEEAGIENKWMNLSPKVIFLLLMNDCLYAIISNGESWRFTWQARYCELFTELDLLLLVSLGLLAPFCLALRVIVWLWHLDKSLFIVNFYPDPYL